MDVDESLVQRLHPLPWRKTQWLRNANQNGTRCGCRSGIGRFATNPTDTQACASPQAVGELSCVVLDVPEIHQLVFQLGHLVPRETRFLRSQIETVKGTVDLRFAEL